MDKEKECEHEWKPIEEDKPVSFATPFLLSIILMGVNTSIIWYRKRRKS